MKKLNLTNVLMMLEKARHAKEGVKLPTVFEVLKKYVNDARPKYFISFAAVNKLGINPTSHYNTPLGIYSYPLTSLIYDQLISDDLPFASEQPYIQLFEGQGNIIYSSDNFDFNGYSNRIDFLMLKLFNKLPQGVNPFELNVLQSKNEPFQKLWYKTYKAANIFKSEKPSIMWNKIFRELGIDGMVDLDTGTIHPSEPTQAVFFDIKSFKHVESFDNPLSRAKKLKRKKTDTSARFKNFLKTNNVKIFEGSFREILKTMNDLPVVKNNTPPENFDFTKAQLAKIIIEELKQKGILAFYDETSNWDNIVNVPMKIEDELKIYKFSVSFQIRERDDGPDKMSVEITSGYPQPIKNLEDMALFVSGKLKT